MEENNSEGFKDFEEVIKSDEEVVNDEYEVVENDEEVIAKPTAKETVPREVARVLLYDSLKWYSKMVKLEKVLKEEKAVKPHLREVIEEELNEVRREKERALWRIAWALKYINRTEDVPEEVLTLARSHFKRREPPGARRPWVVLELLRRYKIE